MELKNSPVYRVRDFTTFNIKCLHILGYFPPEMTNRKEKIVFLIYRIVVVGFFYVLGLLSEFGNMVRAFGDMEEMTKASFLLLTNGNQAFKLQVFLRHSSRIWSLINSTDREEFKPQNWHQYKILEQGIKTSKFMSKMFLFMVFMTCVLWGIFPFLDKTPEENVQLPLSFWIPFETNKSPVFELVFVYQIVTTWINGFGNVTMDLFLSGNFMLISGQLSVLTDALNISNSTSANEALIRNIIHYKNIVKFAEEVTSTFSLCMTTQFLVSVIIICMTMFQMSLVPVMSLQFVSMLLYQLCLQIEIFLWCYYGNEVVVKSEELANAAFRSDWINCDETFKKHLLFFMTRIQVPLKLNAGGYFTISLPTYMAILKSSWSYFAVLNHIHSTQ